MVCSLEGHWHYRASGKLRSTLSTRFRRKELAAKITEKMEARVHNHQRQENLRSFYTHIQMPVSKGRPQGCNSAVSPALIPQSLLTSCPQKTRTQSLLELGCCTPPSEPGRQSAAPSISCHPNGQGPNPEHTPFFKILGLLLPALRTLTRQKQMIIKH